MRHGRHRRRLPRHQARHVRRRRATRVVVADQDDESPRGVGRHCVPQNAGHAPIALVGTAPGIARVEGEHAQLGAFPSHSPCRVEQIDHGHAASAVAALGRQGPEGTGEQCRARCGVARRVEERVDTILLIRGNLERDGHGLILRHPAPNHRLGHGRGLARAVEFAEHEPSRSASVDGQQGDRVFHDTRRGGKGDNDRGHPQRGSA